MKYFLHIVFVIFIFSCAESFEESVTARVWLYDKIIIEGEYSNSKFNIFNSITFENALFKELILPAKDNISDSAEWYFFEKNGSNYLKLYNSVEGTFDDEYLVELKDKRLILTSSRMRLELINNSISLNRPHSRPLKDSDAFYVPKEK